MTKVFDLINSMKSMLAGYREKLRGESGLNRWIILLLALLVCGGLSAQAQVTTVTSNPANGATGVAVSADVVFTFSAAMDTANTSASFYSTSPFGSYPVTESWNSANTVLTCTPISPFPANVTVSWAVAGPDAASNQVFGQGTFTTGTSGGGGSGSGTNAFTTFSAGKLYLYQQLNTGAPTPLPNASYGFVASTALASNRTASAISLMVPGASSTVALTQNALHHEDWNYFTYSTDQTNFESTYLEGNYAFTVTGTPANLSATVSLPTSMAQPNAPHVSNFAAAQMVDVTKGFALNWDAFQNGTSADFIVVAVDNLGKTIFSTPNPGTNGALIGTATSVTIPAGTLTANSTNDATITFYRVATTTNTHATVAFRATETQFSLVGAGSVAPPPTPVVSNPSWGSKGFGFDVATSPNQALSVRYSTDLSQWSTLFTTNSPGTSVHISIPLLPAANGYFRIQNGP